MPSERFARLSAEKKEAIRRAAIEEFKRVPPESVSINRIVRDADISRGSFYTYFEDKDDLLKWIIGDHIDAHWKMLQECFLNHHGDIWQLFDESFDISLDCTFQGSFLEIISNLFQSDSFSDYFREGLQEGECPPGPLPDLRADWLWEHMDPSCRLNEREDFGALMELWRGVLALGLKKTLLNDIPRESARGEYRRFLKILRYGVEARRQEHKENGAWEDRIETENRSMKVKEEL